MTVTLYFDDNDMVTRQQLITFFKELEQEYVADAKAQGNQDLMTCSAVPHVLRVMLESNPDGD